MIVNYLKKLPALTSPVQLYLMLEGEDLGSSVKKILTFCQLNGISGNIAEMLSMHLEHTVLQEKKTKGSFAFRSGSVTLSLTIQLLSPAKKDNRRELARNFGSQLSRGVLQKRVVIFAEPRLQTFLPFLLEGVELGSFDLQQFKAKPKKQNLETVDVVLPVGAKSRLISDQVLIAKATNAARELVDTPAEMCNSTFILEKAKQIAKENNLQIEVLDRAALQKLGAEGLLTVNKGSGNPPYLIKLTKKGTGKNAKKIAFVGKGVTFDTGGLRIKPPSSMEHMKKDMAGAAAVLFAMQVLAHYKTPFEIAAYLPVVENSINELSMRPGDIYRSLSGKFIEITNPDAEGRLILLDAMTLAEREGATTIIDLGTLTGACGAALGEMFAGLFTRDVQLSRQLLGAAENSGDGLWPLPFHSEYAKAMDSSIADLKNSGAFGPGASTAAHFLEAAFSSKEIVWAHIDMSMPASVGRDIGYRTKGATGFGVRLLVEYVLNQAE